MSSGVVLSETMSPAAIAAGSFEFQRSLMRAIVAMSPDGILVVDESNTVIAINDSFLTIWNMPKDVVPLDLHDGAGVADQLLLAKATELVSDRDGFLRRIRELYADPDLKDQCEIDLKDGRTLDRHSRVLRSEQGDYLGRVWFFRDITRHRQAEAALLNLARHDSLTGIWNRRYFFERGAAEFARARRHNSGLSILAIDLDNFKHINDRFGHAAGDEVLKSLCACCMAEMRESDLFARTGGEEFCVLLPLTDLEAARVAAERARLSVMGQRVRCGASVISYTFSAGLAILNAADMALEDTLRRADEALYRAKRKGKNRIEVAL